MRYKLEEKKALKKIFFILLAAFTIVFSAFKIQTAQPLSVVVASNLKPAMDSIISVFELQNPGAQIQVTYGASGKFYEQIMNGAPFDIFFSADMNYPNKLKVNKLTVSPVKLCAIGRLAIWSKKIDPATLQMNSLLDASVHKIAIANPATAPYGARAVESMKYYKEYEQVKSKLVFGESIAQTTQFVAFGAADIGILSLSEVLSPKMKKEGGRYYVIPESSHAPLEQGCVILKHGKDNASAVKFYNFISSSTAIGILNYYGYTQKEK